MQLTHEASKNGHTFWTFGYPYPLLFDSMLGIPLWNRTWMMSRYLISLWLSCTQPENKSAICVSLLDTAGILYATFGRMCAWKQVSQNVVAQKPPQDTPEYQ